MLCTLIGVLIMAAFVGALVGLGHLLDYLARKYGNWLPATILIAPIVLITGYLVGLLVCGK